MSEIDILLSKHFAKETTEKEEQIVQRYKLDNPDEYQAFQLFWAEKNIKIEKFDSEKAWQNVVKEAEKNKPKGLYRQLKIAAAVAAVFLMLSIIGIKLLNPSNSAQIIANGSEETTKEILLEDGSIVYLNANATLHYPEKFSSNQRQVTLQGEAFFEIAKDANRPFRIHTNHSEVEVLGTSFNIDSEKDQTEINVATGKVRVKSLFENESVDLIPNQSVLANKEKLNVFPTKSKNYLSWKTGIFHFEEASLTQVVEELNTYYNNQITLTKNDADCVLNSTFKQLKLGDIIQIIQLNCSIQMKKKNEKYELY